MTLPAHMFISDDGGSLHDTREPLWSSKPLRTNYRRHHSRIDNVESLKATLRAGEFAWPGGYPLFFLMADNEAMSFDGVRQNLREAFAAFASTDRHEPWRVVYCKTNYEDSDLVCAQTGERIPSAYAEPAEDEEGLHHIQETPDSDETLCGADSVLFATSETPDAEICSECRGRRDSQVPIAGND